MDIKATCRHCFSGICNECEHHCLEKGKRMFCVPSESVGRSIIVPVLDPHIGDQGLVHPQPELVRIPNLVQRLSFISCLSGFVQLDYFV